MDAMQIMVARVNSGQFRETAGPNRGPAIDMIERRFGTLGAAWCCIWALDPFYVCRDFYRLPGIVPPRLTGSQELLRWGEEHGLVTDDPQEVLDMGGAIAIRTNEPADGHGHVVPIWKRWTDGAKLVAVQTAEGNTDVNMGANGDGAYSHRRELPLHPGVWHFLRTDSFCGGQWWPKVAA